MLLPNINMFVCQYIDYGRRYSRMNKTFFSLLAFARNKNFVFIQIATTVANCIFVRWCETGRCCDSNCFPFFFII